MTGIFPKIDFGYTLFLDRDGVLNEDHEGSYVFKWTDFKFYEGVLDALKIFNPLFQKIVITTNQRGVGLGLMSEADLHHIHQNMLKHINQNGGRIDKIYYAKDTDKANSTYRKPAIGMGLHAKEDFPEIDFKKSIMVGNNISDMIFGKNLGMTTVFLTTTKKNLKFPHAFIDFHFESLISFAKNLQATEN